MNMFLLEVDTPWSQDNVAILICMNVSAAVNIVDVGSMNA